MSKNEPLDKELYESIKRKVWNMYDKPSAYRSGMLVKLYREAGGKYSGDKDKDAPLNRWFLEKWTNQRGEVGYDKKSDIYRPTIRITKDTPTTFSELTPAEIERAKAEKARTGRVKKFRK